MHRRFFFPDSEPALSEGSSVAFALAVDCKSLVAEQGTINFSLASGQAKCHTDVHASVMHPPWGECFANVDAAP